MILFIVEDNPDVLELLKTVFENSDIHLTTFASAEEALTVLCHTNCDVLLTDLNLPGIPGDELAAKVQRISPETVLFAMTGNHQYGEKVKHRFKRVFNKPFHINHVLTTVELALLGRSTISAASNNNPQAQEMSSIPLY